MKVRQKTAMQLTIVFAFVCGVLFTPITLGLQFFFYPHLAFRFTLCLFLMAYGMMLNRWTGGHFLKGMFPCGIMFLSAAMANSTPMFIILCLALFSWIRSGFCFKTGPLRSLAAESSLTMGSALLITYLSPHGQWSWALAVWLFFLIQSTYFYLFTDNRSIEKNEPSIDPFERSKMQIEKILSGGFS